LSKNFSHGFLYCPTSQQILLQQIIDEKESLWTLLGDQNDIYKLLGLKVSPKVIFPVYDYILKGEKQFIFYAEVKKPTDFKDAKNYRFKWFTLKELTKLPISAQTKQDLIVGRRVIDSQIRRDAGEQTIS
jgi:hypothetical protein